MKKNNKKGFILAETIAVSTVVVTSLVIIYTQFISVSDSYNRSFRYNNVNNLYLLENVRSFINNDSSLNNLVSALENNTYVDITGCPNEYFTEFAYCETLLYYSDIKTILFAKEDITDLKNTIDNTDYSETMKTFIKRINNSTEDGYRLIVEFNDDTYATIKIKI